MKLLNLFKVFVVVFFTTSSYSQTDTIPNQNYQLVDPDVFLADSIPSVAKKILNENFFKKKRDENVVFADILIGDNFSPTYAQRSGPSTNNDYNNGGPDNMIDKFSIMPKVGSFAGDVLNNQENLNKGKINITIPLFDIDYFDYKMPVYIYNNYPTDFNNNMGEPVFYTSSRVGGDWQISTDTYKVIRQVNGVEDEHSSKGYFSNFSYSRVSGASSISNSDVINGLKGEWDPQLDVFHFSTPTVSGSFVLSNSTEGMTFVGLTGENFYVRYNIVSNKINSFTIKDDKGNTYLFGGDATAIEETQSRSDSYSSGFDEANRIKYILEVENEYGSNGWQYRLKRLALECNDRINLFYDGSYGSAPLQPISANELLNQIYSANFVINSSQLSRMVSLGNGFYGIMQTDEYFLNRKRPLQTKKNDSELRRNSINTGWYLKQITLVNGKKINFNYQNSWEAYRTSNVNKTKLEQMSGFLIENSNGNMVELYGKYYSCMPYDFEPLQFPVNETFVWTNNYVKKPKLIQVYDEDFVSNVFFNQNVNPQEVIDRPYVISPHALANINVPVPQEVLDGAIIGNPKLIKKISLIKNNRSFDIVFNQSMTPYVVNGIRYENKDISKLNSLIINGVKKYNFEYTGKRLKKIIYPTGGIKEFEAYSTSTNGVAFSCLGDNSQTINLTNFSYVKSVKTQDAGNLTVEDYIYTDPENPNNILRYDNYTKNWFKTYRPTVATCLTQAFFSSSSPLYDYSPTVNGVIFKTVFKKINNKLSVKSVSKIDDGALEANSFNIIGMNASSPPSYISSIKRPPTVFEDKIGNIETLTTYKEDVLGNVVEDTKKTYNHSYPSTGLTFPSLFLMNVEAGPYFDISGAIKRGFARYYFKCQYEKIETVENSIVFFDNGKKVETESRTFFKKYRNLAGINSRVIYKQKYTDSEGESWVKSYKFLDDNNYLFFTGSLINAFKANNIFPPLEITTAKQITINSVQQEKPFSVNVNKFKLLNNGWLGLNSFPVMSSQLALETNDVISNITNNDLSLINVTQNASNLNDFLYDSRLKEKIVYDNYDSNGRLIEFHAADGKYTAVIWGYKGQYPIAKIENARYSDIASYVSNLQTLSNQDIDNCREATCKEQILRVALNNLRQLSSAQNWMITTYTFDYDRGISSVTNPIGDTVYYEYDELNRLKKVLDSQGNVMTEHNYNYKPQN